MRRYFPLRNIIFDLDGTLVDTLADIGASMNRALEARGFPDVPLKVYRDRVGSGIRRLAQLSLPESSRENLELVESVAEDATRFYMEQPLVHSTTYDDIPELLTELRRRKFRLAVLTNKPETVARLVLEGLSLDSFFDVIHGDTPNAPRKPDPTVVWDLLKKLDGLTFDTIIVGDSEIDIQTARESGCHSVSAAWGFRTMKALEKAGAERIIKVPMELLDCF